LVRGRFAVLDLGWLSSTEKEVIGMY
jgi:hypothetical protein